MHRIVEVKPLAGLRVWLKFSDGVEGIADLSDFAGKGVFEAWSEPNVFDSVFIDPVSHTIAWPGGMDLCPDSLYVEVTGKDILALKGEKCQK